MNHSELGCCLDRFLLFQDILPNSSTENEGERPLGPSFGKHRAIRVFSGNFFFLSESKTCILGSSSHIFDEFKIWAENLLQSVLKLNFQQFPYSPMASPTGSAVGGTGGRRRPGCEVLRAKARPGFQAPPNLCPTAANVYSRIPSGPPGQRGLDGPFKGK